MNLIGKNDLQWIQIFIKKSSKSETKNAFSYTALSNCVRRCPKIFLISSSLMISILASTQNLKKKIIQSNINQHRTKEYIKRRLKQTKYYDQKERSKEISGSFDIKSSPLHYPHLIKNRILKTET